MVFIVKGQDEIYLARKTEMITGLDAMVIVQDLDQWKSVKSCKDLYVIFYQKVLLILLGQYQSR